MSRCPCGKEAEGACITCDRQICLGHTALRPVMTKEPGHPIRLAKCCMPDCDAKWWDRAKDRKQIGRVS